MNTRKSFIARLALQYARQNINEFDEYVQKEGFAATDDAELLDIVIEIADADQAD